MGDDTEGPAGLAVAVVDPDGRLAAVAEALRSAGATVETVPDVAAAADLSGPLNCVLVPHAPATDEHERLDGPGFVAAAERVLPSLPVAVYVTVPDQEPVVSAFEAGADDVVRVPPEREALLARKLRHVAGVGGEFDDPEQRLASLFEYFPHDLFLKDDMNRHVQVTGEASVFDDLEREWVRNLTDYELFDPEFAEELYEEEQAMLERGEPIREKIEHWVDEEGRDRWVSTSKSPRYDEDGTLLGVVGASRDVTGVKRQERMMAALARAGERLTAAERREDVAAAAVDIADDIDAFPRTVVALAGEDGSLSPPAERAGEDGGPGGDDGDPAVFDRYAALFERAFESGRSQYAPGEGNDRAPPAEADLALADLRVPRPALCVPLGEHGVLGLVSDSGPFDAFTVRLAHVLAANVEASLARAARERALAEKNERLREFARLGSHELRNRLQSAFGATARLGERTDAPEVATLERTLEGLDRLVGQLLSLARTGEMRRPSRPVSLSAAAETAWETVRPPDYSLAVAGDADVLADPEALVELFGHLFRDVADQPGSDVTVEVRPTPDGFAVVTEGAAREADDDPFDLDLGYAADPRSYELYVVRALAEAHDWTVSMRAADGGTRFEFAGVDRADDAGAP